jgi:thiamine-monophosphate kinase
MPPLPRHRRIAGGPSHAFQSSREDDWIEWIAHHVGRGGRRGRVRLGIGDDAALLSPRPGTQLVLTVDCEAEGTHFQAGWLTPVEMGRRAVSAAVSDLAAMGARPVALLVSLLVDARFETRELRSLYRGIAESARTYGAAIAGGNISRGPFSITVTAVGEVEAGQACLRSGLRRGDELWVTGSPGLARIGCVALGGKLKRSFRDPAHSKPDINVALRAFKAPVARIREALELRRAWKPHGMIDLSDGLGRDAAHLLTASSKAGGGRRALGVVFDAEALERIEPLAGICRAFGLSIVDTVLAGGEDYELLVAVPPQVSRRSGRHSLLRRLGTPLHRVGSVEDKPGVWIQGRRGLEPWRGGGFEHFKQRRDGSYMDATSRRSV